ncbi:hypothetical protein ACMYR3_11820 [Ampullimonas aquatilis]|uniref:hypothetical protein n=1 Tax=Ampullimonas aquatilis TaxID=1341549 RepID=UPI003C71990E
MDEATVKLKQFCSYCQKYRDGIFHLGGNHGTTKICDACFKLRKERIKAIRQRDKGGKKAPDASTSV